MVYRARMDKRFQKMEFIGILQFHILAYNPAGYFILGFCWPLQKIDSIFVEQEPTSIPVALIFFKVTYPETFFLA